MVKANSDLPGRFFFNLTHEKNSRCRQSHARREGCREGAFLCVPSPRGCVVSSNSSPLLPEMPENRPLCFQPHLSSIFALFPPICQALHWNTRHRSPGSVVRRNGHQVTVTPEAGISRSSPELAPRPPEASSPRHGSSSCLQNLPVKPEMRTLEQPLFRWLHGVYP